MFTSRGCGLLEVNKHVFRQFVRGVRFTPEVVRNLSLLPPLPNSHGHSPLPSARGGAT
jgi:hypothetical protein